MAFKRCTSSNNSEVKAKNSRNLCKRNRNDTESNTSSRSVDKSIKTSNSNERTNKDCQIVTYFQVFLRLFIFYSFKVFYSLFLDFSSLFCLFCCQFSFIFYVWVVSFGVFLCFFMFSCSPVCARIPIVLFLCCYYVVFVTEVLSVTLLQKFGKRSLNLFCWRKIR